jgi:serine/threonine protein phosphatase PrpC
MMRRGHASEFALLTDVGRIRAHNEDVCAADEAAGLYVVCDGMGGAAGGEIASHMATRVFLETARLATVGHVQPADWCLEQAVLTANRAVFDESHREPELRGMGTTLVSLLVEQGGARVWTANVGDSRCYRWRAGELQAMTEDHSFVDEQVRLGLMSAEEAVMSPLRNVITRAVGSHMDVAVDIHAHDAKPDDVYLLCSDGLTCELEDSEIAGVMSQGTDDLQACANALIHLANEYGGADNITVVLVRL